MVDKVMKRIFDVICCCFTLMIWYVFVSITLSIYPFVSDNRQSRYMKMYGDFAMSRLMKNCHTFFHCILISSL